MAEEEGEESQSPQEAPEGLLVGLCLNCSHSKVLETKIGAAIYLCTLSAKNPRYRRFPLLPMLSCEGFEMRVENSDGDS